MNMIPAAPDIHSNLKPLLSDTHMVVMRFACIITYFWALILAAPFISPRPSAWIGLLVLLLSTFLSKILGDTNLSIAIHLLIGGILGATICAVVALDFPIATTLLVIPVMFASMLLKRGAFRLVIVLAGLVALAANLAHALVVPHAIDAWLPLVIFVLVALAAWLSSYRLYQTLDWSWDAYESARSNEHLANERQAELRQALKALDVATYRLERANYNLTLSRNQAEQARRLKQQFAQNISHELRTPLNLIVGFTELMAESPEYYGGRLPVAYLRDLLIVHRNACHLQSLVNDVLDLARVEAAQMSLTPEAIDPAALVEETMNTVHSLVEARGLALRSHVEPALPNLWIDRTRIRQVLINLVSNAVRFTTGHFY